jgi:hypothetical protein
VSFLSDFERTYSRNSDHRIELRSGPSTEINNSDRLKVIIFNVSFIALLLFVLI